MLVRQVEAAFDPREDLDVGEPAIYAAEDERFVLGDEAEVAQSPPVSAEKLDEVNLGLGPDPIGADDRFLSHVTNS
jgi:hypothetical protein